MFVESEPPANAESNVSGGDGGNRDRIWFGRNIGVSEYCNYEMYLFLLRMGGHLSLDGDEGGTGRTKHT